MRRLALVVGAATGVLTLVATMSPAVATPSPRTTDQKIDWRPCIDGPDPEMPPDLKRFECGTYSAPLDWHRPDGPAKIKIAVSRIRATSGTSKGVLFTNPGGPGASGLDMPIMLAMGGSDFSRLAKSMDIVGIDVRGTGESTAITCGGRDPGSNLDPRNRRPGNVKKLLDMGRKTARACQGKSARLRPHVTTWQTVRDLDLLRTLLGAEKVNWLGYSGGTWLGAHYATTFPQRAGRFVLDSNVDFTGSWQSAFNRQPQGFERRFRQDFTRWAAKYDKTYHLGRSGEQVRRTFEKIRADLAAHPLPLLEGGRFYAVNLDQHTAAYMYSKDRFSELARVLKVLRRYTGVKVKATSELSASLTRALRRPAPMLRPVAGEEDTWDSDQAAFLAITCNDTPHTGTPRDLVTRSAELGRKYPLLGWSTIFDPCQYWKRPNVSLPKPTGRGVPPVLMVQSAHDPATPYEGAANAHRRFAGSRLLTVTGEGDHGIYAADNTCVNRIVDAYLIDGIIPKGDLSCKGTAVPRPPGMRAEGAGRLPVNPLDRLAEISERLRH